VQVLRWFTFSGHTGSIAQTLVPDPRQFLQQNLLKIPQPFWLIEAALERGGSISLKP
jgi:hypothetical protein